MFILVDDIYRDEDRAILVEVLSDLGETLPVTIIATTPSFADRTGSIRENSYLDKLPAVSPDRLSDQELARLRQMPIVANMSAKKFKQLSETRKILVVLLQLTEGKPIDEILLATAERLKSKFTDTYRAWSVVVLFGGHNLPVPGSILELIIGKPHFSDSLRENPRKVGSEGIIFPSSYPFKEGWFAGHLLIARFAFRVEFSDTLQSTCQMAVQAASPSDPEHALFLGRMLRFLSSGTPTERNLAIRLLTSHEAMLRCLAVAFPDAMADWAVAFLNLGRNDIAEECLIAAKPSTPGKAQSVIRGLEQLRKTSAAMRVAGAWCDSHPNDSYIRTSYLALLERNGKPGQVKQGIAQTAAWLAKHVDNANVRRFYLGLVERKGGPGQLEQAIAQTAAWLAEHVDNTDVRTFYLGLVERNGEPGQVKQAITQTAAWLAKHVDDTYVRTFYLGLVERKGGPGQVKQGIAQTAAWLAKHVDDTDVRTFYLGLVERNADKQDLDLAVRNTDAWLRKHSGKTDVWCALIAVLIRTHQPALATEVATAAMSFNPTNQNLTESYLDLIASQGAEEDVEKIFDGLENRFPRHRVIPLRRARWLGERGRIEAAEAGFATLREKYPQWPQVNYAYGRHLLSLEKVAEAMAQFEIALGIHRGFQMAHEGKAQALRGLATKASEAGDTQEAENYLLQAEQYFKSAIYWAGVHAAPAARFYTALGWFYLDEKRCEEALSSFESAIGENPEHFSNYWGKGAALKCLGKYSKALDALNIALSKAPQPLEPPASEEIPRLIDECRKAK